MEETRTEEYGGGWDRWERMSSQQTISNQIESQIKISVDTPFERYVISRLSARIVKNVLGV